MAAVNKIDSNATGLRYAEEASLGVLPGTPDWIPLEPNEYDDFGGELTTVARNPINASRQRKKGVVTDLDASGGFTTDITQTNLQDLMQGFFFADFRRKGEEIPTAATATTDLFDVAATAGFQVNDLVRSTGWAEAGNNGDEMIVTAIVTDTTIEVLGETLETQASPAAAAALVVIGHQAASADVDVVVSGALPLYESQGGVNWTTLGLIPGEWIFVGGDGAAEDFANAENNGWKRIRSISATELVIDKSDSTMVVETGSGITARFYFGRVLKNETSSLIVRRSYNLERQLGAPDGALPAEIQAEYIEGQVPGEFTMNIPTADKLTADLAFVGTAFQTIDGPTSLKTGNRPALTEADAFNTSSDFSRIKLAQVVVGDEAPTPLFAFAQEITISINNNLTPNKAVGTLGSFEVTAGSFAVSGEITAYFADVAAVTAVQNNVNITLDFAIAKANAGMVVDLPLITLGDGRPNVEQDEAITLPLSMEAATAALIDSTLDYTLMWVFFDYLPTAAE